MNTYHISYDLKAPRRDYTSLYEAIQSFEDWCHPLDSTWYINTASTAIEVRDLLATTMDSNDKLLVTKAKADGAWRGLNEELTQWLQKYL